jgi:hypothetical protein
MKALKEMDPRAAFPDPKRPPAETDLPVALGKCHAPVEDVLTRLRSAHPEVTAAWQFSAKVGWYEVLLLGKRRLLYLVPRRGGCRVSLILGGRALATLRAGRHAARLRRLLRKSRRHPEGTAFDFDHTSLEPDLLVAFLEAKTTPEPGAA